MKKLLSTKKFQLGFTLIELLVVITIIAILIAVGAVSYTTVNRNARNAQRASDLNKIAAGLEEFYTDHGHYPPTRNDASPNGTWESASRSTDGDHTNCLLGGTASTNFIKTSGWWDWCGINPNNQGPPFDYAAGGASTPAWLTSYNPSNVYIANGEFNKFPRDPLGPSINNQMTYAYASNGQTYALATKHYEGTAPAEHRFTGGEYCDNALPPGTCPNPAGAPWPAQLFDGNQYIVRSPNHN